MPKGISARERDLSWIRHFESRKKRHITQEELRRICKVIRKNDLPCEMHRNGSGPMITVYAHPPVPSVPVEKVFTLEYGDLPVNWKEGVHGKDAWKNAWDVFSPLTHRKRNLELLALYDLEVPREYASYIY